MGEQRMLIAILRLDRSPYSLKYFTRKEIGIRNGRDWNTLKKLEGKKCVVTILHGDFGRGWRLTAKGYKTAKIMEDGEIKNA